MSQPHQGDAIDWHTLSLSIPSRTPKQCRERWNGSLNPQLNNTPWTKEELNKVYSLINNIGTKWNDIAVLLGTGRSGLAISNLYYAGLRREKRSNGKNAASPGDGAAASDAGNEGTNTNTSLTSTLPTKSKAARSVSSSESAVKNAGTITTSTTKTKTKKEEKPETNVPTGKKRGRPSTVSKQANNNNNDNNNNDTNNHTDTTTISTTVTKEESNEKRRKKSRKNETLLFDTSTVEGNNNNQHQHKLPWELTDPYGVDANTTYHSRFGALIGNESNAPPLWIPSKNGNIIPNIDNNNISTMPPALLHSAKSNHSERNPKDLDISSHMLSATNKEGFHAFMPSGPMSTSSTNSYLAFTSGNLTRSLHELQQTPQNNSNTHHDNYTTTSATTNTGSRGRRASSVEYHGHHGYHSASHGGSEIMMSPTMEFTPNVSQASMQHAYPHINKLPNIHNSTGTINHTTDGNGLNMNNNNHSSSNTMNYSNNNKNSNHHQTIPVWNPADTLTPYNNMLPTPMLPNNQHNNLMFNNNNRLSQIHIPWGSPTNMNQMNSTTNNNHNHSYGNLHNFTNYDPLSVKSSAGTPLFSISNNNHLHTHLTNSMYSNNNNNSNTINQHNNNSSSTSNNNINNNNDMNARNGRSRGKTVNNAAEVLANLAGPSNFGTG